MLYDIVKFEEEHIMVSIDCRMYTNFIIYSCSSIEKEYKFT